MPANVFDRDDGNDSPEVPVVLGVIFAVGSQAYTLRRTRDGTIMVTGAHRPDGTREPCLEAPWGTDVSDWTVLISEIAVHCEVDCFDAARLIGPLIESHLTYMAQALVESLQQEPDEAPEGFHPDS